MEKLYDRCLRCNRKLKTEASRKIGYGKTCFTKALAHKYVKPLFEVNNEKKKKRI